MIQNDYYYNSTFDRESGLLDFNTLPPYYERICAVETFMKNKSYDDINVVNMSNKHEIRKIVKRCLPNFTGSTTYYRLDDGKSLVPYLDVRQIDYDSNTIFIGNKVDEIKSMKMYD